MVNIYKDLRGKIFAELKRSFGRSTLFDVNGPLRIENRFKKVFKVEVVLFVNYLKWTCLQTKWENKSKNN